jgi:hypothetical protein
MAPATSAETLDNTPTFDAAQTRKPKLYTEFQVRKPKDKNIPAEFIRLWKHVLN